jgi:hypothetical protein
MGAFTRAWGQKLDRRIGAGHSAVGTHDRQYAVEPRLPEKVPHGSLAAQDRVHSAPRKSPEEPMTEKTEKRIDEAEAQRILEDLARHGPASAQVAAIKVLREMDKDERAAAAEADRHLTGIPEFDKLYGTDAVDLTAERSRRAGEPAT